MPPKTLQVSCVQMQWAATLERNIEVTLHYVREAARAGSRVVLFPEANLTSYYFPYLIQLPPQLVDRALDQVCQAANEHDLWIIAGTIRQTHDRFLNLAHVIAPSGEIVHEYAKVNTAGRDEKKYCRGGDKVSLFEIDGVPCTLVICRDGRHPELYRIPAMAGAKILFHPSCSSDEIEAVAWKRVRAGRSSRPDRIRRFSIAWRTRWASRPTANRLRAEGHSSGSRTGFRWRRRASTRRK